MRRYENGLVLGCFLEEIDDAGVEPGMEMTLRLIEREEAPPLTQACNGYEGQVGEHPVGKARSRH